MSEIFFIRHAQASFGAAEYDKISELGLSQAEILGEYFAKLGLKFDAVYSGSMERHIITARRVISRNPKGDGEYQLRVAGEFNEYDSSTVVKSQISDMILEDPPLSEALPRIYTDQRSFQRIFEKAVLRWISGKYDSPGLETWHAFTQRVRSGIRKVMDEHGQKKRLAVFTSGGPLSAALQMALGLSHEDTIRLSWQIRNASVSTFKYNAERISLLSFNSVAHLELKNDPSLLTYR
jgi:broad specificity phosphatase PhoE